MIEIILVFALAIAIGWPLGLYLARVMRGDRSVLDRVFGPVERAIYRLLGTDPQRGMSWKGYAKAFVLSNLALAVIVWVMLLTQAWLPLNPDHVPNMRWDLALHTMVSFLTNTNQQHYSGQAQLSYLSQMVGIVGLQVITPMMGLALVVATLRGLFGGRAAMAGSGRSALAAGGGEAETETETDAVVETATDSTAGKASQRDLGNYWVDLVRATLRFMLPLCLLWTLLLGWQGVPATLQGGPVVAPVDVSVEMKQQKIPLGPWRRWWRSSSSAPTAAAGMAPTVRWRWRTRPRFPTCWKRWHSS